MDDLKQKEYKIEEATNIESKKDKRPLPIFMLTFDKEVDIRKIYEIKEILGMKIVIEALRKNKLVPQCKTCQAFGHTQKYCKRKARCVKCAGMHHTTQCTKSEQTEPKCANCGETHPANYRGCKVAKRLQEIRNAKDKANKGSRQNKKTLKEEERTVKTNTISTPSENKGELTYARITNNNIESNRDKQNSTVNNETEQIIKQILKSIELINKRLD